MFNIDLDLVRKYDKPGPRYTSYPTAPQFHEGFKADNYLDEIIRTNNLEQPADLSLYFHIPFCDTLCYFCGCNMIISRNRDRIKTYTNYVKNEIDLLRSYLKRDRKVAQIHWGGGTPTHLLPDEIKDLKVGDIVILADSPVKAVAIGRGDQATITIPNKFVHPDEANKYPLDAPIPTDPSDENYGYLIIKPYDIKIIL